MALIDVTDRPPARLTGLTLPSWRSWVLSLLLGVILGIPSGVGAQVGSEESSESDSSGVAGTVIPADESEVVDDGQIRSRIENIYAHLDGLADVSVEVADGIVTLRGRVDDLETLERAEQLAGRVAGTVLVLNDIRRDRSVGKRFAAALSNIWSEMQDGLALAPLLLLALLVVGLAALLARWVGRAEGIYQRLSRNWFVRDLIRQIVQLAIVVIGLIIALQLLDATALLGSVVGALGILGLAIGFATRDTVENYIASVLLSLRQPFRHEDYIRIDDMEGKVLRLTPRATVLMSLDGNHLRIPNARVFKATIVNYTRNPLRRFEFTVGVDTDLDLVRPRDLAVDTLSSMPGVLAAPAPQCLVEALGDSNVILKVSGWIDQRESDFRKVRSEAQRLVKDAFDAAGIVMPEPIYNVNLRRRKTTSRKAEEPQKPAATERGDAVDTLRDQTVEKQMRAEKHAAEEEDLLDPGAPAE